MRCFFKLVILLVLLTTASFSTGRAQTTIYVDSTASAPGDGTSWSSAYPALQDAFDEVNNNAGTDYEIWIAKGTYYPDVDNVDNDGDGTSEHAAGSDTSFTLVRDGVEIYGGFSGSETSRSDRDPAANTVILSGDVDENDDPFEPSTDSDGDGSTPPQTDHINGSNASHVLFFDGTTGTSDITSSTILDGVTVTGGQTDGLGGGILCDGSGSGNECSPSVENVTLEGNHAGSGGAVFNIGDSGGVSSPSFTDVTFRGNLAEIRGGGVYNDGGDGSKGGMASPTFSGGVFRRNAAGYRGGALFSETSGGTTSPDITNVDFTQNSAPVSSSSFTFPAGGGAIVNSAFAGGTSSTQITESTFKNNRATSGNTFTGGGAIFTFSDTIDAEGNRSVVRMSITKTSFSNNQASNVGGAVYSNSFRGGIMASEYADLDFSGNEAGRGGAMKIESLRPSTAGPRSVDSTVIRNVTFSNNRATDRGGALFFEGRDGGGIYSEVTDVTFASNDATNGGGAIEVFGNGTSSGGTPGVSAPLLKNSKYQQNTTDGPGGALVVRTSNGGQATPTLVNSAFAGNSASSNGGAVENRSEGSGTASPTFVNVSIAGNTAGANGGALANYEESGNGSATPTVSNSILWANTADADGDGSGTGDEIFVSGGAPSASYSIVEGGCPSNVNCGSNLLSESPQFAGVNGGAGSDGTFGTEDDDLRIQGPGSVGGASPAIDAGENSALDLDGDGTLDVSDGLAGNSRRLDVGEISDTGDGSAPVVDMGPYESDGAPLGSQVSIPRLWATSNGQQVELSWSPASAGVQEYRVYRATSSFSDTTNATWLGSVTDTSATDASDLSREQPYHYRILPVGSSGTVGALSEEVVVELPPPTVSVETSIGFGDATDQSNYRPVAFPGGESVALSSVISGEPGPEGTYRAYREEGASGEQEYNVVECGVDGGVDCSFEPGVGLWLLSKESGLSPDGFENVTLTDDGTYAVPLNSGWNLVANPFSVDVSWASVQKASGDGLGPLYERTSNGSWNQVSTMASAKTGTGYYVKNTGGLSEMVLPHPTAADSTSAKEASTGSSGEKSEVQRARAAAQTVALGVYAGKRKRGGVTLGLSPAATVGLDTLDVEAPPFPFATVSLRAKAETEDGHERLLRDYRPAESKGQRFPLRLAMPGEEMVTVRADSLNVPDRYEVVLVERSLGRTHDLRKEGAALHPEGDRSALVLLVGTPAYVEKQKKALAPDEVKLLGNYPNPVQRSTTLEYALPEKRDVRLVLYDVLGRRVQVLVDGQQRAGFHRVRWTEAKRLASGVYFYRLRAGETTKVKKMTVVR